VEGSTNKVNRKGDGTGSIHGVGGGGPGGKWGDEREGSRGSAVVVQGAGEGGPGVLKACPQGVSGGGEKGRRGGSRGRRGWSRGSAR
jgi:hypothetical protein